MRAVGGGRIRIVSRACLGFRFRVCFGFRAEGLESGAFQGVPEEKNIQETQGYPGYLE